MLETDFADPSRLVREAPGQRDLLFEPSRCTHRAVRTHILAAFRLFTCQRALRQTSAANLSSRRARSLRLTSGGGGILATVPPLSTGLGKKTIAPPASASLMQRL